MRRSASEDWLRCHTQRTGETTRVSGMRLRPSASPSTSRVPLVALTKAQGLGSLRRKVARLRDQVSVVIGSVISAIVSCDSASPPLPRSSASTLTCCPTGPNISISASCCQSPSMVSSSGRAVTTSPLWPELPGIQGSGRSEEHTSELQSLMRISYAVFCLKKKKNTENELTHANYMTITKRIDDTDKNEKQEHEYIIRTKIKRSVIQDKIK